ncbi:MAG: hypothetical protein QOK43_1892 [Acidimicrobiaceae bacterium]|nr:hypothetical protein [Acidimicrobiaceae bacterium]
MRRVRSATIAVALLALFSLAGCGGNTNGNAAPTTTTAAAAPLPARQRGSAQPPGPCVTPPAAPGPASAIDWLPKDLPLPPGTYAVNELAPEQSARRAVLVVPATPDGFAAFVGQAWAAEGWRLGRPESEGFEAENRMTRPPAYGGFKVRSVYCDGTKSELTIAYSPGA